MLSKLYIVLAFAIVCLLAGCSSNVITAYLNADGNPARCNEVRR